ncbi:MAG: Ribosomal RNA small subunit methyltransferase E [Parcubacteria group bacterium GW2011_GWB1_43_8]|nr:MAG: Ribosomal RNA small subunit methyltransferase E [Parcubacteria group bacterium GW2011_GWB1_43_8]
MRLNRFFINENLKVGNITVSDMDFINQAKNVLRLKTNDKLILGDGNSNEAVAEIVNLNKEFAELKILETCKNKNESENYAHLYCSVLKKENFEWAVQKAVEVGVKEITPTITARTVKLGLNRERLEKIIKEAAEQSGRGVLPKLNEAIIFDEAIKSSKENGLNLFFQAGYPLLGHSMSKFEKIGVFVGPEGGWTEEEIKKAQSSNEFTIVGLGKTILRAETAAVIASYQAVNLC